MNDGSTFEPLMGITVEVYIDDMLAKSASQMDHMLQLRGAFKLMR